METGTKSFRYRSSESDRLVLKTLCIIGGLIASIIGVVAAIVYFGMTRDAERDRATLDLFLAGRGIDRIEFLSPNTTNLFTGLEAQKFVASLQKTNRISNIDWTKQQAQSVKLLSGTNEIWLSLGEDGAWEFNQYGFRLRSQ